MQDLKNYIRIFKYLKPYKWLILASVASSLLVATSLAGSIGGIKPAADLLFDQFDVEAYQKLPLMDTPLGSSILNKIHAMIVQDKFRTLLVISGIIMFMTILRSLFEFIHGCTDTLI